MHWQKKKLTYDICIPPIKRHYYDMTDEEAQAYFDWYMEVMPQRIDYLSKTAAAKLKCDVSTFDLSPESLIPLWRWFLTVVEKEPSTEKSGMIVGSEYQLSLQSEYILRDIGMYLGKTLIVNDPLLYWEITKEPKTDIFYNQPVIAGFYPNLKYAPCFEPIHMARIQGINYLYDKSKEEDLYNVYMWEKNAATWYRNHICSVCGGAIIVKHEFKRGKDKKMAMMATGYTCERCKKAYSFSELGLPPEYILGNNEQIDKSAK